MSQVPPCLRQHSGMLQVSYLGQSEALNEQWSEQAACAATNVLVLCQASCMWILSNVS